VAAALGRAAFTGRLLPGGQALHPIDPLILSQTRATFSFVILAIFLFAVRGSSILRIPLRDFVQFMILGVFGICASNYLYYLAIQRTNVATAIILQYTAPIWVLLYTVARGQQRLTLQRAAAVGLAVTGIAFIIGITSGRSLRLDRIGVIAAVFAAFSFAFYNIGGHSILTRYDRWTTLAYVLFGASLLWELVNPPWKVVAAHYSGAQWVFLLVFSLVSVLGPFSFYFAGLQYLEPTRAIVVSCLEPVFSIVIAAIALGEVMRPMQTIGIVLVLTAIVVVQMPDRASGEAIQIEPLE
jgi:drug/metabolite transporter (DMT)-like permease